MFKRLSIFTVILSGILLAGCANQQSADTQSASQTEQTKKSSPKKTDDSTKSATSNTSDNAKTNANNNDDNAKTSSNTNANGNQKTTNQGTTTNQTNNGNTNSNNTANNNQSSTTPQNQTTQTDQGVNLTTSDQAVEYLADKLSATYDKTTTQYVANGKVTWDNVSGYQINIYSKNSDSPVGSYLVPANGQYFQIW